MTTTHSSSFPLDAILLLGPTGVGKSPLGDALASRGFLNRRCHHLDFGCELRSISRSKDSSSAYTSAELDFIIGVLERGLLLEDQHFALARKIISLALQRFGFARGDILVLNGIPRHAGQAQDMASLAIIHALVVLDCSADTIYCRLKDNVGGDRTGRDDDHKELVTNKLSIFSERTRPLIEHYAQHGTSIYRVTVTATSTTDDAYSSLSSLAATYPPVSLVSKPPER